MGSEEDLAHLLYRLRLQDVRIGKYIEARHSDYLSRLLELPFALQRVGRNLREILRADRAGAFGSFDYYEAPAPSGPLGTDQRESFARLRPGTPSRHQPIWAP